MPDAFPPIRPAPVFVGFDFESHLFLPGLLAPPGVCASLAYHDGAELLPFDEGLDVLGGLLEGDATLAVANGSYDFALACATPKGGRYTGRPELLPLVFDKFERGEVFDVQIAVALDAVADGLLFKDPNTGGGLRKPNGKQAARYSLDICSQLVLGRYNAKENDEFRLRYAELEHLPIEEWPETARQYPIDDAVNTRDVAVAIAARGKNLGLIEGKSWSHQTHQARAAFAMHLACVWGLRTDGEAVEKLAAAVDKVHDEEVGRFVVEGLLRPDGSKNTGAIKAAVLRAYGSKGQCATCAGTGKVPSPKNPKSRINCKTCGGAGLDVPEACPRTDKGGISTDRDTLEESGDDVLEAFGAVSRTEKVRDTYVPFLRSGVDAPITLSANVLVESGRASYDGLIQLLPRTGGIRECFVAREGRVFCSVDYAALELSTLAQVCLWTVGHSAMADAINASGDPGILHTKFGAKLVGVDEAEFVRRVKAGDKVAKNQRQMAKAANFGFPGLMGAVRLVIAKRKEGLRFCIVGGIAPACPCGGDKACRRCYGRGALCGTEKITEWYGRPIPPTCTSCISVAQDLRKLWLEQWPEVPEYFDWVKAHPGAEDGGAVTVSPGTGYVRGGLNAASLANHGFQSLAAFGAKHALWKVSKECYTDTASPLFGSRPVIFAHDEVITELLEDRAHEAAYRQAEIMVAAMREFVPDVCVRAEPAIARRWFKEMEAVHDAAGRLIPWSPKV